MNNPVIYIFINKSLGMSSGKVASQAAQAAAYSIGRTIPEDVDSFWLYAPHKTVIVFEARDAEHLRNIQDYLKVRTVQSELVIDEGSNEVPKHSATALVTEMMNKSPLTDKLMSTFDLYESNIERTVKEFGRAFINGTISRS